MLLSEAGQAAARARGVRVLGCCTLRAERGSWGAGWAAGTLGERACGSNGVAGDGPRAG